MRKSLLSSSSALAMFFQAYLLCTSPVTGCFALNGGRTIRDFVQITKTDIWTCICIFPFLLLLWIALKANHENSSHALEGFGDTCAGTWGDLHLGAESSKTGYTRWGRPRLIYQLNLSIWVSSAKIWHVKPSQLSALATHGEAATIKTRVMNCWEGFRFISYNV